MKNNSLKISIPKPCHEDWNKMTPNEKGAFCSKCCKTVIDFSKKTADEISTILKEEAGKKVCGKFSTDQLDNTSSKVEIPLYLLPNNLPIAKAFALALFVVFGTGLFSCTGYQGQTVGEIAVIDTLPEQNVDNTHLLGDTIYDIHTKGEVVRIDTTTYEKPIKMDTIEAPTIKVGTIQVVYPKK